jgi:hypothetical protein
MSLDLRHAQDLPRQLASGIDATSLKLGLCFLDELFDFCLQVGRDVIKTHVPLTRGRARCFRRPQPVASGAPPVRRPIEAVDLTRAVVGSPAQDTNLPSPKSATATAGRRRAHPSAR